MFNISCDCPFCVNVKKKLMNDGLKMLSLKKSDRLFFCKCDKDCVNCCVMSKYCSCRSKKKTIQNILIK